MISMMPRAALIFKQKPVAPLTWCSIRYYCEKKLEGKKVKVFETLPKEKSSLLQSFVPKWSFSPDLVAYLNQKDAFTAEGLNKRNQEDIWKLTVKNQEYNPARHNILGANLATAHFLVSRGGAVKLSSSSVWIRRDEEGKYNLPGKFVPNLYVEEIDASNTGLMYEGFSNLEHLYHLRTLKLRNCRFVDDWCLDRLHIFASTQLEYLDISSCQQITERGLCSLHKLRNLKTLVLEDLGSVKHKDLIYIMLEECIPNITIVDSQRQQIDIS